MLFKQKKGILKVGAVDNVHYNPYNDITKRYKIILKFGEKKMTYFPHWYSNVGPVASMAE